MAVSLQSLLAERAYLLADGATGTSYFEMGLVSGDAPELWNVDHPERVAGLHAAFIGAGADIVLTNSFGGSSYRLKLHAAEHRVGELNEAAARIARVEADRAARPVAVGGSMGPTGELFEPLGPLTVADGARAFEEQARALARGGADVLWLETLSSVEELQAAVTGASAAGLPIVTTLSFDTNGSTMMGVSPLDLAVQVEGLDPPPLAYGTNCGVGPAEVVASILSISRARPGRLLVAKANCGVPEFRDGAIRYDGTPELMADYARLARAAGARIIGGCCGTSPAHLAAMREALREAPEGEVPDVEVIESRLGSISPASRSRCAHEFEVPAAAPRRTRRRGRRETR